MTPIVGRAAAADMTKRSVRMKKIFDIAKAEERKVCEAMGRAQRSLDAEISRLDELESYRRNYAGQFSGNQSVSPARWQDYQNFLQRIDQAVEAQKEQVMVGKETRNAQRRRWLVKKQKLDSLERVVARIRKGEDQEDERRTQKTLDELTSTGRSSTSSRSED